MEVIKRKESIFVNKKCQSGFGIPLVLFTLFAISAALYLISSRTVLSLQENSGFRQRMDREILTKVILSSINCFETNRATYTSDELYYFPYENRCTSNSYNQNGRFLKLSRLTPEGPKPLLGNYHPADGIYRIGDLLVRATCSASENGYVIQSIPAEVPNKGSIDKLTGKQIAWNSKEALLIGKPVRIKLCSKRPPPTLSCEGRSCYDKNPQVFSTYTKE